jgi:hemerythrin
MSLFEWKAEYSVGNPEIDLQHRQIFRMAGELHGAMVNGLGNDVVEVLLDKVVAYTRHHFASEECLMKESAYPGYEKHRADHEKLAVQIAEFQEKIKDRKVAVAVELIRFLRDWLDHHIHGADLKLGIYLRSRLATSARQPAGAGASVEW